VCVCGGGVGGDGCLLRGGWFSELQCFTWRQRRLRRTSGIVADDRASLQGCTLTIACTNKHVRLTTAPARESCAVPCRAVLCCAVLCCAVLS
jgi:hypothetical protein